MIQLEITSSELLSVMHTKVLPKLAGERRGYGRPPPEEVSSILKSAFREIDEDFLARHRTWPDGTTAVVAVVIIAGEGVGEGEAAQSAACNRIPHVVACLQARAMPTEAWWRVTEVWEGGAPPTGAAACAWRSNFCSNHRTCSVFR